MTVQDLINILNKIEDKNRIVVHVYDGMYSMIEENENLKYPEDSDIQELTLYTSDEMTNLYDYKDEEDAKEVKCLQISFSG